VTDDVHLPIFFVEVSSARCCCAWFWVKPVQLQKLSRSSVSDMSPLALARSASEHPNVVTPEAKIKQLEHQLSMLTAERNDLAADVENMCMQSTGDIFSASSVLGERICNMQKETNKLQSQVIYLSTSHHDMCIRSASTSQVPSATDAM